MELNSCGHGYREEITPAMKSYIRFLHASPNSPAVDLYLNNNLVSKNLTYKKFTEYAPYWAGTYVLEIYPAGTKDKAIFKTNVTLSPMSIYTCSIVGTVPEKLSVLQIYEPKSKTEVSKSYIRFSHLSPNTSAVDIALPNGTVLFKNVSYKKVTPYISVPEGVYNVHVRLAGTDTSILYVPNIRLKGRRFYTVYAVGLLNDNPPLQALIPLDGNSYIEF